MADARHSKCRVRKGVWVRIPPPASLGGETGWGRGANRGSVARSLWRSKDCPDRAIEIVLAWQHRRHLTSHSYSRSSAWLYAGIAIRHRVSRTGRLHCRCLMVLTSVRPPSGYAAAGWQRCLLAVARPYSATRARPSSGDSIASGRARRDHRPGQALESSDVRRHRSSPSRRSSPGSRHRPLAHRLRHSGDEPDANARRPCELRMPTQLEAAVNEADKLDLVDPVRLRRALDGMRGNAGFLRCAASLIAGLPAHRLRARAAISPAGPCGRACPRRRRAYGSTASASTSSGPSSGWSSRRTACGTTARQRSRPGTVAVTRSTPPRG